MKVFDVFLFFNELDLLELRLHTLNEIVDYFVITEARVTFSGKPKPLYYEENKERFAKFKDKIIHNIIENSPDDFSSFCPDNQYYTDRFVSYPHKSGGVPLAKLSTDFQREVYQRDSIINGLLGVAGPDDVIVLSDLDEIPNPKALDLAIKEVEHGELLTLCQKWYMYFFNVQCDDEWFGTRVCKFDYLEGRSIDLLRHHLESRNEQPGKIIEDGGWHFSFLGGAEKVKEKLAAYSYQGRRSRWLLRILDKMFPSRIEKKIISGSDIFNRGRKFKVISLDRTFPDYLYSNQEKFKVFIKS